VEPPTPRPKVLAWYRGYCLAMSLLYVVVFAAGIVVAVMHDALAEDGESSAICPRPFRAVSGLAVPRR
jgi:hypothetical protein